MARLTNFPAKLDLVMKALSFSRGRLAADLGVDKSVVARWATGAVSPSDHNLAALTDPGGQQESPASRCSTGIARSRP
jgi:hypothetical protein